MVSLKHIKSVIDKEMVLVCFLSVVSTALCIWLELEANIPIALIGLAVVFPIVFSINAAYKRRESALGQFGVMKAHAVALYFAHRDWMQDDDPAHVKRIRKRLEDLFRAVKEYLEPDGRDGDALARVYGAFSAISRAHEDLRKAGLSSGEISRLTQFNSKSMIAFEQIKLIADYRTPLALRGHSSFFLNVFPVAFGPFFAYLAVTYGAAIGYFVAIFFSIVLVSLDNLQEHLEDPFDSVGVDDIDLEVFHDYAQVILDEDDHSEE